MEEILVEEIAVCYWRLRRALVAEEGEISSNIQDTFSEMDIEEEQLRARAKLSQFELPADSIDSRLEAVRLRHSRAGVDRAVWVLQLMLIGAEEKGYYPETYDQELEVLFADDIVFYANLQAQNSIARSLAHNQEASEPGDSGEVKLLFKPAEWIKTKLTELESLQKRLMKAEALRSESIAKSLNLPPAERSEQILRYETTIKRHLYRAMDQLERLQRRRKGEYVPPPVKVGIQQED